MRDKKDRFLHQLWNKHVRPTFPVRSRSYPPFLPISRIHFEIPDLYTIFIVGELGDYDTTTHQDGYLSGFQFVPNQVRPTPK